MLVFLVILTAYKDAAEHDDSVFTENDWSKPIDQDSSNWFRHNMPTVNKAKLIYKIRIFLGSFLFSFPQVVVSFRRVNDFLARTDLEDNLRSDTGQQEWCSNVAPYSVLEICVGFFRL